MDDLPWVEEVKVRFREQGMVFFGEVYVVTKTVQHLEALIKEAQDNLQEFHWKIHDVCIMVVKDFDQMREEE